LSFDRRLLGAVVALLGCADLERGAPLPADAGPDAAAVDGASDAGAPALSFARDVHRLLLDGCARCHAPGASAGNTGLLYVRDAAKDRESTISFINREQPASSRLLGKGAGQGHGGGAIYAAGSPEHRTILDWILQGASP
jgi:mono/diheme cytochrome c family protein